MSIKRLVKRVFPLVKYRWNVYTSFRKAANFIYFRSEEILNVRDLSAGPIDVKDGRLEIETVNAANHEVLIDFARENRNVNLRGDWAPCYIKNNYRGFIAKYQGNVIGYFWWWAEDSGVKPPPEMLLYDIKPDKGEVYGFNFFVAPQYRGRGNAFEFMGRLLLKLGESGYKRVTGVYGPGSLAVKWTYRVLGYVDIKSICRHKFLNRFACVRAAFFARNSDRHPGYPGDYRLLVSFRKPLKCLKTLVRDLRERRMPFSREYYCWSVAVYEGESPFRMSPSRRARNPVLTARHVKDIRTEFVADPFMLHDGNLWHMFFEAFNTVTQKGEIGLAVSRDGYRWKYKQIILKEPFHLSYPCVFKWQENFYMVPETSETNSVRLYKAAEFPGNWHFAAELLTGADFVDPSIAFLDGKAWLFVSTRKCDTLRLFYSDSLTGPWHEHPMSPVVKGDPRCARSGGRLLVRDGKMYRFSQDDEKMYGRCVNAFEITKLTVTEYEEKLFSDQPIVAAGGKGWNALGMHHIDIHPLEGGRWISAVDGHRGALKYEFPK